MSIVSIVVLATVQGLAEMLPVSSSAHVILTEKLMGLDPSRPDLTFLLVMLHTGTMCAALLYFSRRWKALLWPTLPVTPQRSIAKQPSFEEWRNFHFLKMILLATALTGAVGLGLKRLIEKVILEGYLRHAHGEVENLFDNLPLIAIALLAAGVLIIFAGTSERRARGSRLGPVQSMIVGLVQGLCLPFRGFSRSGSTISTGIFLGVSRRLSEEFSFALAVALTPAAVFLELHRLLKNLQAQGMDTHSFDIARHLAPGLLGMLFSFIAGLIALRWLSSWLENGRWRYFGYYCVIMAGVVLAAFYGGL